MALVKYPNLQNPEVVREIKHRIGEKNPAIFS